MAERTGWSVFTVGSGPAFIADGTIPAPNDDFSRPTMSTQVKVKLADGSDAFVVPETKFVRETIRFIWLSLDITTRDKIVGYVENDDLIKIVDHNTEEYIGKFIRVDPIWIVGEVGTYDIEGIFETMPSPI